ncbi:MAG: molecular chaperone [Pseudomonadota bacterium]
MIRLPRSIAATCLSLAVFMPGAFAEVLIAPTRVVLERGERSAELIVVNKGEEETAFRLGIENRRMLIDGSMEEAETPQDGENFAAEFLRFSPRRVVLDPGGRQTIRISATPPAELPAGEYRSHLRLMSAPTSAGRTLESATSDGDDGLSIQLIAIRSLTIPIIVRVGDLDAELEISDVNLRAEDTDTYIVTRLERSGERSAYGDLKIFVDGNRDPIYFARGVAVYTPNTERDVILPLPEEIREEISGKSITVTYESSDPENPGVLARHTVLMP